MNAPTLPKMTEIWLKTLKWQPSSEQQELFQQLYAGVLAGNQRLNLTRITEPEEFWEKHLWDSIAGAIYLQLPENGQGIRAIDIGTGAGFPGLPLAIALPDLEITLLDSTQKKTRFIEELIAEIGLTNVTTLSGRAEQLNQQAPHAGGYNFVTIRAVGQVTLCASYALPFLGPGGMAVLYRGQWTERDFADLQASLPTLGGKIAAIERFFSPLSNSLRHCIYISKT